MVLSAPDMLGVFWVVAALQSRKTDVCVCTHVLCMPACAVHAFRHSRTHVPVCVEARGQPWAHSLPIELFPQPPGDGLTKGH